MSLRKQRGHIEVDMLDTGKREKPVPPSLRIIKDTPGLAAFLIVISGSCALAIVASLIVLAMNRFYIPEQKYVAPVAPSITEHTDKEMLERLYTACVKAQAVGFSVAIQRCHEDAIRMSTPSTPASR